MQFTFDLATKAPPDGPPQVITSDHDLKEMKRALVYGERDLRSGKVHTVKTGPTCEVCGQTGLAYRRNGETRILVCSHVERGLDEFFWRRSMNYETLGPASWLPQSGSGTLTIYGTPVESVPCGRHLMMTLRMRYCWFD